MPDAPLRLAVPAPAPPPARPPLPLVAALAPVVVSVAIWAVTGSAFALLFAALGPVVAGAGLLDGLRQRRTARRREAERYAAALDGLARRVDAALEERRGRSAGRRPDAADPVAALAVADAWARPSAPRLVLGLAELPSGIELEEEPSGLDAASRERLAALRARAATLPDAELELPARGGVGILGPEGAARALARDLLLQLAAQLSPASAVVAATEDGGWLRELPHAVLPASPASPGEGCMAVSAPPARTGEEGLRVAVCWAVSAERLAEPVGALIRLGGAEPAALLSPAEPEARRLRPGAVSRAEAAASARRLAGLAARQGLRPAGAALPERVALAELADDEPAGEGSPLAVAVGRDADGPVRLDLLRDGPHALVAGTTGSGKSELLVSWVLALARRHPPERLSFLLVDFKGGASFAPLAGLRHVAGVVSDLDGRRARRAMTGLRAELRRRERLLAAAAAGSIEGLPPGALARLLVVVDEYAAVVADHPELHAVFADLAARGRSLGIHLVLCTQRPSGVVRDAILANVTLRIALRLTDRADSQAMLGSDAAARLPASPAGRAVVRDGGGTRLVQLALADASDAERARSAHPAAAAVVQPWADPLPTRLRRADLAGLAPPRPGGLLLGLADLPEEQRHAPAAYEPREHGALLVLGAPRSGRSTALAALVEAAGPAAVVVPGRLAPAWGLLEELLAAVAARAAPPLVALDDLDELLLGAGPAHAAGLCERLERLLRRAPAAGCGVVLSATGTTSALGLLRAVPSRLLLRQASREDHLLAGLDAADFDPEQPAGAGWWRGRAVQLALPAGDPAALLAAATRCPEPLAVRRDRRCAVVSARPVVDAARWRAAGVPVVELGGGDPAAAAGESPALLVGDPDAWQASWSLLAAARRELPFLVDRRVPPAELRALTRLREEPPPLEEEADGDEEEWWLVADGRARRARIAPSG